MITRSDLSYASLGAGMVCVLLAGDNPLRLLAGFLLIATGVVLAPARLTN